MSRTLQLVRLVLWSYVFGHAWLSWRHVVPWPIPLLFLLAMDMAASGFAKLWPKRKKTCALLILFVLMLPFVSSFFSWIVDIFSPRIPLVQIYTHLILSPLWLPMWGFFALSILVRIHPHLYRYGLLPRLVVLLLSFWAGGNYQILFYKHPGILLSSLLIYLAAEAFVLVWQNPAIRREKILPLRALPAFVLFILPMAVLCFMAYHFIANTLTRNGGGVIKPTVNSFDFSDYLNLESEIQLGQNLLLFVHLNEEPKEKLLFKRHSLAGYSPDKGFYAIKDLSSSYEVPGKAVNLIAPTYLGRELVKQQFFLVDIEKYALFSLDYPTQVIPMKMEKLSRKFKSAYMVVAQAILDRDNLEALPGIFLAGHTQLSNYEKTIYLDYANMAEISDLAQQIVGDEDSSYNRAKMLETYLKLHYLYSLKPGEGGKNKRPKDALFDFLFKTQKGYCTYFAFSMALMARSLDMPARVVSGFFINPKDAIMGYYPVKSQQAHAWVEIYFDDFGWISFDPTSDQIAVDSLDSFSPAYQPDDLYPFVEEILKVRSQAGIMAPASQEIKTMLPQKMTGGTIFSLAHLLLIAVIILLIYSGALLWAHWPFLRKNTLGPRQLVQLYARRLVFQYNQLTHHSHTVLEYLHESTDLLDLYRQALFAASFDSSQARHFITLCSGYVHVTRIPYMWRLCFLFSPVWIKFRMNYAPLF